MDETVFLFNMMEKQCEIQMSVAAAAANGMPYAVIPPADAEFTGSQNNE